MDSVILEEDIDEDYEPTTAEIDEVRLHPSPPLHTPRCLLTASHAPPAGPNLWLMPLSSSMQIGSE